MVRTEVNLLLLNWCNTAYEATESSVCHESIQDGVK
jgi:hypothetical protein